MDKIGAHKLEWIGTSRGSRRTTCEMRSSKTHKQIEQNNQWLRNYEGHHLRSKIKHRRDGIETCDQPKNERVENAQAV